MSRLDVNCHAYVRSLLSWKHVDKSQVVTFVIQTDPISYSTFKIILYCIHQYMKHLFYNLVIFLQAWTLKFIFDMFFHTNLCPFTLEWETSLQYIGIFGLGQVMASSTLKTVNSLKIHHAISLGFMHRIRHTIPFHGDIWV